MIHKWYIMLLILRYKRLTSDITSILHTIEH